MRKRTILAAIVASGLALVLTVAVWFLAAPRERGTPRPMMPTAAPLPPRNPDSSTPGVSGLAATTWIRDVASATGIPRRALRAYAGVALAVAVQNPGCGLAWNTLAGIGYVESRNGEIFGATIAADGTVSPPIYGVTLDGAGFAAIPDTDGGAIDGDAKWDRAVGPMQLLPEAWRNWAGDASGDSVSDVNNIDDAAWAAAGYLCRAGADLSKPAGWRKAVLAYNASTLYLDDVIAAANRYATAASIVRGERVSP